MLVFVISMEHTLREYISKLAFIAEDLTQQTLKLFLAEFL